LKSWGSGDAAEHVFQSALALREALREMAKALANHRPVPRRSLEAINSTIRNCPGRVLLARGASRR
jgi:hypothetical protein